MTSTEDRIEIKRSVVSVSRFPNKSSIDKLIKSLRTIKARGKLVVHLSDGGITTVQFEASHELNGHDHLELQFAPPQNKV